MDLRRPLALYIVELQAAANATHAAEDRPRYERLLADAAVLLALTRCGAERYVCCSSETGLTKNFCVGLKRENRRA
jgi:hypothetical protein